MEGGLILKILWSACKSWPGLLCCVIWEVTLHSQFPSLSWRINGYRWIVRVFWQNAGGGEGRGSNLCDGLAFHPEEVTIFLATFCYRNKSQWASLLLPSLDLDYLKCVFILTLNLLSFALFPVARPSWLAWILTTEMSWLSSQEITWLYFPPTKPV